MARVKLFSTTRCPMCEKTRQMLLKWRIPFEEIKVDQDRAGLREMARLTGGARSVPQIAIDGSWIGSFMELTELHMDNGLDHLVAPAGSQSRRSGGDDVV
jgi:glutaredoxin 3